MAIPISQAEAVEMFDLPTEVLYVCDGKRECGKPCCTDYSCHDACHHTSDISHALYESHDEGSFERFPAVRNWGGAIICVEPVRG